MKNTHLIILILIFPLALLAQNIQPFYEHYTGLISEELKITADLVNMEDSFSGYYYYQFKENKVWKASKPIPLDGRVGKDKQFVLNEFGESHSFFQGILESSKLIKGEWVNEMLSEPVEFTFKATYSKGSIPLNAVESSAIQYFQNDLTKPSAKFHISALFPSSTLDQAVYHQLQERIFHLLAYRGNMQNQADVFESLQKKYFQQFQNSLENIKLDSFPESFNWEKSVRIDVINNEGGFLCLQVETYAKTGKQDGARVKKYLVFNVNENKVLNLNDLLSEENQPALNNLLLKKLQSQYRLDPDIPLSQAGFFQDTIAATRNFYIHPGGLGFYYNVYEIAPLSNGPTDLFLTWWDLKDILEPLFK